MKTATAVHNILANASIGTLPEIPTKDGYLGLWHIDGKAISAGTVYSYGANKSATITYYDMMDVSDQVTFHNWPDEANIKRIPVTISNSEGNNTMIPAEGLRYHWNDHQACALENAGIDVMEYIYLNDKSARTIINENIASGKYKHEDEGTIAFPFNVGGCYAPVTVEVSAVLGVYIRVMNEYIDDLIAEDGQAILTFKAGLGYLSSATDATAYYWAKDVDYLYDTTSSSWGRVYTATVVNGETSTPVEFTVNNRAEKLAEIKAMLPENTADYVYSWAEALPAELALNNDQVFTVVAKTYEEMTIAAALEAADGTMVKVSGTVSQVNTAWSESYGNISVTIVDADGNELYLYRLATNVALGDIITVKGKMATYSSNRQVAAGATAEITGHDSSYDYVEKTILEAIEAADGVNVIVTGTVVKIATAYSSSYNNISVYIADEAGNQLYLYRLTGEVVLNDIITVKGTMATYSGNRQVTGGTFEKIGTHECSNYTDATCEVPATCVVCGVAKDDVLADHNYVDGFCTVCEAECPYVTVNLAIDQEVEITIPAGKYAKAELYAMAGGYVLVYYWQDLIIEINGEEYAYEPVKLLNARQGANEIIIKSVSGEAVTDTITLSPYTQDEYTMNVGANEVYVLDAQMGRNATFTADVDGEYTFSFAEGEENGAISLLVESEYGTSSEMITMPYTVTLTAGETVTFAIGTMNWETDTIEINVDAPYVTSEIWLGEENTISIPEGKYFFSNVYSFVGGKFTASWTGDVTVEINGVAVENGAVVELKNMYEGANTFVIKAANNAAVEVVLNVANYKEPATPIAVGNVNVTVTVENYYCAGVEVIFTATEAGEYKLSVAEGEENADVTLVEGNVTEWIEELPYSFTLEAGESITFIIATANLMVESDEINLVLEKVEVTPPAGGDDEGEGEGTNPPAGGDDEGEGEGTTPPAGDDGEGTTPPADDEGEGEGTNPPASDEEEKPGIIDKITGVIPQPIKDMVGCSGVVGGIAGGAAALGLAVVALLKKKEDNE